MLALATPHIAGYSLEGKARGTQMIYEAFCQKFGYEINKRFETQLPACEDYFSGHDLKAVLKQKLSQIYDIAQDDANIRACVKEGKVEQKHLIYYVRIIRCAVNGQLTGTTGMSLSYQPTCSIDALKARAKLYTQIRQFLQNVGSWKLKHPWFHKQV